MPAVEALFAKLRVLLTTYGITDFTVYAVDGSEASLAFSCGETHGLDGTGDGRVVIANRPELDRLLGGAERVILRGPSHSADALLGATAAFPMRFQGKTLGFILVYGSVPEDVLHEQFLDELLRVIALFAGTLGQRRTVDSLRRDHERTQSQLRELYDGLDILLLTDGEEIEGNVLGRALEILGSHKGALWVRDVATTQLRQSKGDPSAEELGCMQGLVERCYETGQPGLLSSLSGEETWEFDVDTIYIAQAVAFPLRTRERIIGGIAACDVTVSVDLIDVVEGTARVGATAIENWENSRRMLERQRLQEQLRLAANAQQRLQPSERVQVRGLSVAHLYRYCDETGGDYADTIPSSEVYLCGFAVGDVSGHGLGAAMLMVDVRARLRTLVEKSAFWSPEEVLTEINRALCLETGPDQFVTLFLCWVDTRTGLLRYASAGAEPPLLYRAAIGSWESLPSTGLPLGVAPKTVFEGARVSLGMGDILVMVTDGVTEATNARGQPLGAEPIQDLIAEEPKADPEDLLAAIFRRTLEHREGQPFADDLTYLLIKVDRVSLQLGEEPPEPQGEQLYQNRFPCSRAAKDECLRAVQAVVGESWPEEDSGALLMSLEEALTNAVVHGNGEDPFRYFEINVFGRPERFMATIEHHGEPFDPRVAIPAQLDAQTLRQENGRGILIMASFMDEVLYWNQGRSVCLRRG